MKYKLDVNDEYFHVHFYQPVRILSSAILNGGFQVANHFFNAKVEANLNGERTDFEKPDASLNMIANRNNWEGTSVGMMTAAYMKTFRKHRLESQGIWIEAMVTAGVSNARRAGDTADYQYMNEECKKTGTINILVITNANLTDAAMVESVMMVAEAKAVCMQNLQVKSQVSNLTATGTGTDSTAIASGFGPEISYCGKHVLFGELLAKVVIDAVSESLKSG